MSYQDAVLTTLLTICTYVHEISMEFANQSMTWHGEINPGSPLLQREFKMGHHVGMYIIMVSPPTTSMVAWCPHDVMYVWWDHHNSVHNVMRSVRDHHTGAYRQLYISQEATLLYWAPNSIFPSPSPPPPPSPRPPPPRPSPSPTLPRPSPIAPPPPRPGPSPPPPRPSPSPPPPPPRPSPSPPPPPPRPSPSPSPPSPSPSPPPPSPSPRPPPPSLA